MKKVAFVFYFWLLAFVLLALIDGGGRLSIFVSVLFLVEIYFLWFMLAILCKYIGGSNRAALSFTIIGMISYFIVWLLLLLEEVNFNGLEDNVTEAYIGLAGVVFYVSFIYVSAFISKRLIEAEIKLGLPHKSSLFLSLLLILLPFISFSVLQQRVRKVIHKARQLHSNSKL